MKQTFPKWMITSFVFLLRSTHLETHSRLPWKIYFIWQPIEEIDYFYFLIEEGRSWNYFFFFWRFVLSVNFFGIHLPAFIFYHKNEWDSTSFPRAYLGSDTTTLVPDSVTSFDIDKASLPFFTFSFQCSGRFGETFRSKP